MDDTSGCVNTSHNVLPSWHGPRRVKALVLNSRLRPGVRSSLRLLRLRDCGVDLIERHLQEDATDDANGEVAKVADVRDAREDEQLDRARGAADSGTTLVLELVGLQEALERVRRLAPRDRVGANGQHDASKGGLGDLADERREEDDEGSHGRGVRRRRELAAAARLEVEDGLGNETAAAKAAEEGADRVTKGHAKDRAGRDVVVGLVLPAHQLVDDLAG